MNNNKNKGSISTLFIFLLSPFFALIPVLLQLKYKKDKYIPILISILFGIMSYLYIPLQSNDKAEYFKNYLIYQTFSISELNQNLIQLKRPDFIFYYLIYFFSRLHIDFNFFFFIITTITVYSFLLFAKKILKEEVTIGEFNFAIPSFFLIVLGLSLPDLFSGIRFLFSGSIFIWSLYYFFWNKNIIKGISILLISIFTHFSFVFFIPPIILLSYISKKINPKILLFLSLSFLFIPSESISEFFNFFTLPENYNIKKEGYLSTEWKLTENAVILLHIKKLWIYFGYVFLLFIDKAPQTRIFIMLVIFISFLNITFPTPIVFNRYSVFVSLIFVIYIIYLSYNDLIKPIYFKIFLLLFFISTLIDIYVMRPSFMESFRIENIITIVNIFSRRISPSEFL